MSRKREALCGYYRMWWLVSNRNVVKYHTLKAGKVAFVKHRFEYPDTPVRLFCMEHSGQGAYIPIETTILHYGGPRTEKVDD